MDTDPKKSDGSRENVLAIALVVLSGGMILFLLYLVSFGIVGNVLMVVGAVGVAAGLHYLLWGKAFSDEVAAEREALLRKEGRALKSKRVPPDAIQDLARTQGIQSGPDA